MEDEGHTMVENVSFIVIARNEVFAVDRCLRSFLSMPLENCEILAIDSDSTDGTLNIMKNYAAESPLVSVFRCTGYVNAAVARNVGLDRATKKYICFCDGDTEWTADFIRESLRVMEAGEADAVTGGLTEQVYSSDYDRVLETSTRVAFASRRSVSYCGGNSIMRKAVTDAVGSWDERLMRNEDIDYTLRVSRHGRFIALPVCMGTHHTQRYEERTWRHFRDRRLRYHGVVLWKNLDRPKVLAELVLKKNRGFLFGYAFYTLFAAWIVTSVVTAKPQVPFAVGLLAFVALDLILGLLRGDGVLKRLVTHYCYPSSVLCGFVLGAGRKPAATVVEEVHY